MGIKKKQLVLKTRENRGTLSNVSDDDKESHEQLVTVSDVILFKFSSE